MKCFKQQKCDHNHNKLCHSMFLDLDTAASENNSEDLLYRTREGIKAIKSLNAHLVHSKNQDLSRTDVSTTLTDTDVPITQDWTIKFIPQKYQ